MGVFTLISSKSREANSANLIKRSRSRFGGRCFQVLKNLPTLKNLVLRFLLGEKVWEKLKYGFNSSKGTEKKSSLEN